ASGARGAAGFGWPAAPAGSRATATSAAKTVIRVVITLYIRGRRLEVNIWPMSRPLSTALLLVALLAPLAAQSRPDPGINARIREEENSHSQIMKTLHMLTDVYGPRVTGSPNLKAAG